MFNFDVGLYRCELVCHLFEATGEAFDLTCSLFSRLEIQTLFTSSLQSIYKSVLFVLFKEK